MHTSHCARTHNPGQQAAQAIAERVSRCLTVHIVSRHNVACGRFWSTARRTRNFRRGAFRIEILKRYEKWKDIAMLSGPQGLRAIRGFRDEALSGDLKGCRSSRLSEQWRVIYSVEADVMTVQVVRVTPHDYRRH